MVCMMILNWYIITRRLGGDVRGRGWHSRTVRFHVFVVGSSPLVLAFSIRDNHNLDDSAVPQKDDIPE